MKKRMSKDQALAAATALLECEPKFSETWLGQLGNKLRREDRRVNEVDSSSSVSRDTVPKWFDPASPGWSVMHPSKSSFDP